MIFYNAVTGEPVDLVVKHQAKGMEQKPKIPFDLFDDRLHYLMDFAPEPLFLLKNLL